MEEEEDGYAGVEACAWKGFVADHAEPLRALEVRTFANKRVLITGAGGFLGSALARAIARLQVDRLVLVDHAEYGLYRLEQDLCRPRSAPPAVLTVGSVCDEALMHEVFAEHAPEIVFHAAALKHVPLMERNIFAAAETNILGTEIVAQAAAKFGTERFVLLSTDKAVEPISVMGATKRIAEQIVLRAREERGGGGFLAVRLCNVLGSTGSVAPLFLRQIAQGGPVTVSAPECTRFFISLRDATNRLLRAATLAAPPGIVVPNLGPARRVLDLARYLIGHATAGDQIEIVQSGLRPADKLHERLVGGRESISECVDDPSSLCVESDFDRAELSLALAAIRSAVERRDRARLLGAFQRAVPEFGAPDLSTRAAGEVCA